MLSMDCVKNAAQAASYFESENYYTKEAGLELNYWWGDGAERLGLKGDVDAEQFRRVLEGYLPDGHIIERATVRPEHQKERNERFLGTDATFSAPKSVSLAALVQGETWLVDAHRTAVSRALEYGQENCAFSVGKSKGKSIFVQSDNLLVACFTHDTARQVKDNPIDPQLHTHAVIINATQRKDGKWVAAPNTILMRDKMLMGAIYRAELAKEIQSRGYQIRVTSDDGQFEIEGPSDEQLRAFSQRRVQIEKHMAENGLAYTAQNAALAAKTSRSKKTEIDRTSVFQEWAVRANDLALKRPQLAKDPFLSDSESVYRTVVSAADHLLERSSFIHKREILKLAMQRLVGVATIDNLERAFDRAIKSKDLVEDKTNQFTSLKIIHAELENRTVTRRGLNVVKPILSRDEVETSVKGKDLSVGQVESVSLLASTSRYVVVQGYAGTGKTTMLNVVKELAESKGFEVRGFVPSAAAADVLKKETGMSSQTLASHLIEMRRTQGAQTTNKKSIWIVDESSMISTKAMNELLKGAERQQARVWFIGDKQQLSSIEAGNPFAQIQKEGVPVAEMKEIHRQKNENLKAAVVDIIEGRVEDSLKRLSMHGVTDDGLGGPLERILPDLREIKNRDRRLQAVVQEYFLPDKDRRQSLVITSTNEDKRYLNHEIRNVLKEKKELQGPSVTAETLSSKNLTQDEKKRLSSYSEGLIIRFNRDYQSVGVDSGSYYRVASVDYQSGSVALESLSGSRSVEWKPSRMTKVEVYNQVQARELQAGDTIRWTRNDKETGFKNGDVARVVSVNSDSRHVLVEGQDKKQTNLDLTNKRHWDYGYCSTVHAAQGQTCDRVIAHFDTGHVKLLSLESAYVAFSRARNEVKIFTDDIEKLPKLIRVSRAQKNVLEPPSDLIHGRERQRGIER